jgi:two-component system alkaline phosphatase synthesis response regulator PhoP
VKKRILVVEDDVPLGDGLRMNLDLEGFEALHCRSAEEAEPVWEQGGVDFILLDVGLPGEDGFAFCRRIRSAGDRVPILFLTARDADDDRIRGLEEGGDDYLTKPFHLGELLARIKGIFRREEWARAQPVRDVLRIGESTVDLGARTVTGPRGRHELGEKEALILRLLAERNGEAVDRHTILDRVWGYDAFPTTRTVDNFVVRLRRILEDDPSDPRYLATVRGIGYRLVTNEAPARS